VRAHEEKSKEREWKMPELLCNPSSPSPIAFSKRSKRCCNGRGSSKEKERRGEPTKKGGFADTSFGLVKV